MERPRSGELARGTRVVRHDDPGTVGVVVAHEFPLLPTDVMVRWPGHSRPERVRDLTLAPKVAAPPPGRRRAR